MMGLPARGKTYVAHKLQRYLSFFHGAPTRVFNVGNYRRSKFGVSKPASWFDSNNEEGERQRQVLFPPATLYGSELRQESLKCSQKCTPSAFISTSDFTAYGLFQD